MNFSAFVDTVQSSMEAANRRRISETPIRRPSQAPGAGQAETKGRSVNGYPPPVKQRAPKAAVSFIGLSGRCPWYFAATAPHPGTVLEPFRRSAGHTLPSTRQRLSARRTAAQGLPPRDQAAANDSAYGPCQVAFRYGHDAESNNARFHYTRLTRGKRCGVGWKDLFDSALR
jgi:hypothetical protein